VKINVASELKSAGRTTDRHLEEECAPVDLGGHKLVFTMPLSVDITYAFDGEGFNAQGVLSSELLMNCTKCNAEFRQPFSVDFSERFIKAADEEAEELECYAFSGEVLELDRMVLDLIVLNAPVYGLCKPDWKGLCPQCGCDLNITQCACVPEVEEEEETPPSPFAQLAKLLNNEEEV
jgi:uncharacterized protein